jgi:hypothetical protein
MLDCPAPQTSLQFKTALAIDPSNVRTLSHYGCFLHTACVEYKEAAEVLTFSVTLSLGLARARALSSLSQSLLSLALSLSPPCPPPRPPPTHWGTLPNTILISSWSHTHSLTPTGN